jgi:hypothetical protein
VTHVQPQISSAPCTFCRARSVCHVADRYPPLSKTTCRSQSIFTFRINSSGAPSHPDLKCSHIVLVMVQAWSRAVQVARSSPISIKTPPYCSRHRSHRVRYHSHKPSPRGHRLNFVYPARVYYYIRVRECPSILKQKSVPSSLGVISYPRYVQPR